MTTTFPELDTVKDELKTKRKALADVFAEAGDTLDLTKVKSLEGSTTDKAAWIKQANDELTELSQKRDGLQAVKNAADALAQAGDDDGSGEAGDDRQTVARKQGRRPSLAKAFIESAAYKQRGTGRSADIDVKTVLSTTAGFAPDDVRIADVVPIALRPVELVDLIPKFATAQSSITWMEQTTRTNAAAETAEAGAKPEATIVYTERTSVVRKIAVVLPVTDEQIEDVPQMESILQDDLVLMVRQRLSDQIASGDGTPPNLRGILNTSGIQTQAKGTDPVPDAVYKAMVLVMTTGQANPDAYVTNPLDWQDVRLLRTADGIYIWGNPSEAGPERIWGLRTVLAQGMTQNTGVVGDWSGYARLAIRKDVTFDIGYQNDDFGKNKRTLRAEMRAALFFRRPAAFCSVTGI